MAGKHYGTAAYTSANTHPPAFPGDKENKAFAEGFIGVPAANPHPVGTPAHNAYDAGDASSSAEEAAGSQIFYFGVSPLLAGAPVTQTTMLGDRAESVPADVATFVTTPACRVTEIGIWLHSSPGGVTTQYELAIYNAAFTTTWAATTKVAGTTVEGSWPASTTAGQYPTAVSVNLPAGDYVLVYAVNQANVQLKTTNLASSRWRDNLSVGGIGADPALPATFTANSILSNSPYVWAKCLL